MAMLFSRPKEIWKERNKEINPESETNMIKRERVEKNRNNKHERKKRRKKENRKRARKKERKDGTL